jgi:hypothetical protein
MAERVVNSCTYGTPRSFVSLSTEPPAAGLTAAMWQLRPDTTLNASFVLRRSSFEPHRMQDSLLGQIIVGRPKRWQSVCQGREQENDMTLIAGSKATHTNL